MGNSWTKVIVVFLLMFFVGDLAAQTPWKCDGRAIGTYNPGSNSYTDDTKLYSAVFDAAGNVTYIDKTATAGIGLNAIGYRKQDGFVYGVRYTKGDNTVNELCRIDSAGSIVSVGDITGLKANVQYFAGAVDANGYLYVSSGSGSSPYQLYKIDIATRVATDLGTLTYRLIDMAFDPITNELYATSAAAETNTGNLIKINTATNPATITDLGSMQVFMFGIFFTDAAQLYGFGRAAIDNSTAYYKMSKTSSAIISAGAGPSATNADACSCPYRLSHTLQNKATCLNPGQDSSFTVTVTNITSTTVSARFTLTMDKRFFFTETATQIQNNVKASFPGSTAAVNITNSNGGTNNAIVISDIAVSATSLATAAASFKLAFKTKTSGFIAGEHISFQSVLDVPGGALNLGADVSDNPLTAQLDDATTLTICGPEDGSLPVSITDFKGQLNQKTTNLSWDAVQELNIQRYEVERSFNGESFAKLADVTAKGISNRTSYQFADVNIPANAVVYYRLKIVENSGLIKYSSIIALKMNDLTIQTTVYPSPFKDKLAVNTYAQTKGNMLIEIIDGTGRKLIEKNTNVTEGNNTITLNGLNGMQEGFYFIKVYNNGKLIQTKKTMKMQ
ncbi:T9SS type A sorting domain-containing protein [Ferruginibacter lapsinanis]|uniref:DUF6923 family protein n=1 Tax=Ferruginibacter lapsinanis TaxID=563172 RepID=UPI001E5B0361|nr:T9SS type A sorting domain-containing protein [Ferruginibacter lapsinanis]UEG49992.1 T9SS type A sorting domain-containing protein [Ferruginibacter lapsinanis]